jgi:hypothetical protein
MKEYAKLPLREALVKTKPKPSPNFFILREILREIELNVDELNQELQNL